MACIDPSMPIMNYSDRREVLFFKDHYLYLTGKVLDIGCGTGNAADFYNDYTGITLNRQEIDTGVTRGRNIKYMDAENLSLDTSTFDGFIMWDSLEHFLSPYRALCEARRVLKPNGRGLIFMPGQNWVNCHEHLHVMTVPQMEQLLKRTFFRIASVYEKTYPNDPDKFCEGMAVYEIINDIEYIPMYET